MNKQQRWYQSFRRYEETRPSPNVFGAFDIETRGLDGEILGIGWMKEGGKYQCSSDPRSFVWQVLAPSNRNVVWYGHNAGEFDLLHLSQLLRQESRLMYHDSYLSWVMRGDRRAIGLTIERPPGERGGNRIIARFRDSMALLPVSLDQLASQFATTQKMKGTVDFEGGEVWDFNNPLHQQYLEADVRSLLESVTAIRDLVWERFNVNLRLTAAATALRVFQSQMPEDVEFMPLYPKTEAFVRSGLFGGFTFVLDTKPHVDVVLLDVNSLYPFVMRDRSYPVGLPEARLSYDAKHLGIWKCDVYMDDRDIIPIVPLRTKDGLVWPIGSFQTTLTTNDIEYARKLGYRITTHEGYVWPHKSPIFREYITGMQSLKEDNPGTALASLAKLLMNSTYGKFGQRREQMGVIESDVAPSPEAVPVLRRDGSIVEGIWLVRSRSEAPYIQPQIAAFITSYARTYYHSLLMKAGGRKNVIYGDTDSMIVTHATDALPMHQTKLGHLKLEAHCETFQAIAPKTWTATTVEGDRVFRSKGIPRRLRTQGQTTVSWEGLQGTMTTLLEGGTPTLKTRKRTLPTRPPAAKWETDSDGSVHPLRVGG